MENSTEEVRDARDAEAIKLLKTDPAKFFEQTRRRRPFGFVRSDDTESRP